MEKLLSQWSLHDKYGQSKTKNWRWLALICSAEFYKEKHKTVGGVCENFPFIEVSYDLEMLGWEKCIKSFLLEMLKHQFLIKLIMRGALNGSGYCIASARLYCSDSILFEMMHWTVGHEQHSYSEILRKIYTLSISSCVPYWFYCLYVCWMTVCYLAKGQGASVYVYASQLHC